jgi:protein-S-isoprenylcysteine O-methyltransferase Ste14
VDALPLWIVAGSWLLWVLSWVVLAVAAKQDVWKQSIDDRERYSLTFVASLVIMALSLHAPLGPEDGMRPAFARLVPLTPGIAWASAILALLALILALWARLTLGRNWSGMVALKDEHELVTAGPYRLIRHPIYAALILLVLASAIANRTPLAVIALALMILSCWTKLRAEEEMMSEAFPETYPAYMAQTKRLVPGLV